jgi:hypothetical protein
VRVAAGVTSPRRGAVIGLHCGADDLRATRVVTWDGDDMTRALLSCGVVGPALFVVVFLVEGAVRPGYRPWRHFVSLLAHGDRGWVQALSFGACGALILGFALGVARVADGVALPILLAVFGAGLIASGRFRCDAGLGYPPGAPQDWPRTASKEGNRHNLAGAAVFGSLAAACFLSAARSDHRAWTWYCVTSGVLLLVLFVVIGALAARASQGADPPIGIAQRLAILVGWTWIAVLALRLLSHEANTTASTHRAVDTRSAGQFARGALDEADGPLISATPSSRRSAYAASALLIITA